MPFKFNAARRHRIPRARCRVRNWPAYEVGLKRRGDLTLWIDEATLDKWQAPQRNTPGGQAFYSDLAIEMVLMLRTMFHLALRQAEAFSSNVFRLMGLVLRIPDHTALSRRSGEFCTRRPNVIARARHLLVDSTGLKLFGQGEWNEERYGRRRRSWRKLHLAIDADTGEIIANVLTENDADDIGEVPGLLEQIDGEIISFTADGAYDGEPVYQVVVLQQHDPPPNVAIPLRASAVLSTRSTDRPSQRDRHIQMIAKKGRIGWQKASGYGRRRLAETVIGRYKHLIGSKLRARSLSGQQGEVAIAVRALNRMINVAKPISVRVT